MTTMPFFRWFPEEAMTDMEYCSMTFEERGFFHTCLNYAWINDGLPTDLEKLRRTLDIDSRKFKRLWSKVGPNFLEVGGKLRQSRQEVERTYVRSRSASALKAIKTRYERTTTNAQVRSSTLDTRHQTLDTRHQIPEQELQHLESSDAVWEPGDYEPEPKQPAGNSVYVRPPKKAASNTYDYQEDQAELDRRYALNVEYLKQRGICVS